MSINATVTRDESGGWLFTWSPGVAPYSIYLDGVLRVTQTGTSYLFTDPGYETLPPDLEILNSGDVSLGVQYPPYQILQWRGVQGAFAYLVQQFFSGVWTVIATIPDSNLGYYQYQTTPQTDGALVQYRVYATDTAGNVGAPVSFSLSVCRVPQAPAVALSVSSSSAIVIAGA